MSERHEVISAFLDDEPFDPSELAEALSEPAGRALLLDFLAMRHLVQPRGHQAPAAFGQQRRRAPLKALIAAAAVFVALAGGYFVGQRSGVARSEAPPATRVADAPAAWQEVSPGRMR
jgi:hypothetical protein